MRDGKGDGQCWDSGCTNTEHTRPSTAALLRISLSHPCTSVRRTYISLDYLDNHVLLRSARELLDRYVWEGLASMLCLSLVVQLNLGLQHRPLVGASHRQAWNATLLVL
jgi:hypothetical protein